MHPDIIAYNDAQETDRKAICELLASEIHSALASMPKAENKLWHGSPVWFLDGNPVAGYSARKHNIQLLFWSGQSFHEAGLEPEGSFKAAEARYTEVGQVNVASLHKWLEEAKTIQWDYKNIIKRRGELVRLTDF